VSQRSWIQRLFDSRPSYRKENRTHRIFCKMFNISKKTRWTDGHPMTAYTGCIDSRGKNRHFYIPRPSFFVCLGDAPVAITQNVAWMKRQFNACQTPRSMYHLSSTVSQLFEPQVQKIAVFTYHSPHFCFPWRRPCDYHAIFCMDGKTIQCLPNPSQHLFEYFPSYTKSMRKSKNRYFYHMLVPLGTPLGQSR